MIKERSIVLYIILSIITCGIFLGYTGLYVLQKTQMLLLT